SPENPESWPHTCVLAGQWMKSLLKLRPAYRLTVVFVLATGVPCRMEPQGAHSRPSAAAERAEVKNVFWQPDEVKQGSPVMISVELSGPARDVNGTWLGKRIRFWPSDKPRLWVALAGADVDQKPGASELRVNATIR